VEILGHLATEWDYLFEDFTRCPSYEANVLKITVLVRKTCKFFFYLTLSKSPNMLNLFMVLTANHGTMRHELLKIS